MNTTALRADELLTAANLATLVEAAEILDVPLKSLKWLAYKGIVNPQGRDARRANLYDLRDIEAARDARKLEKHERRKRRERMRRAFEAGQTVRQIAYAERVTTRTVQRELVAFLGHRCRHWTAEEVEILQTWWRHGRAHYLPRLPGRTAESCRAKVHCLRAAGIPVEGCNAT